MLNVKAKAADRSKNRKHVNSINLFVVVRGFASAQRANDELIEGLADAHPSSPINHGFFHRPVTIGPVGLCKKTLRLELASLCEQRFCQLLANAVTESLVVNGPFLNETTNNSVPLVYRKHDRIQFPPIDD